MKHSIVGTRYAKSLLNLAIEKGDLDQCYKDMQLIASVCKTSKDLANMLKSPVIRPDKKLAVLNGIFNKELGTLSNAFVEIITKKKREMYLKEIAISFQDLYKKHNNITTAKVSSAIALDKDLKSKIMAIVKQSAQGDVDLVEEINEDLIGGFVLRIDDTQVDASIQNKLNQLKKNFSKNPYVKEF